MDWAVNQAKLQRAILIAGTGASEKAIKEAYIKLGGLVNEVQNDNIIESVIEEVAQDTIEEVTKVATKPKGRPRRQATDTE